MPKLADLKRFTEEMREFVQRAYDNDIVFMVRPETASNRIIEQPDGSTPGLPDGIDVLRTEDGVLVAPHPSGPCHPVSKAKVFAWSLEPIEDDPVHAPRIAADAARVAAAARLTD